MPTPPTTINSAAFPELQACLTDNAEWAARTHADEPEFFASSAKEQRPFLLWIGCADSRVPESVVLGQKPGEVFVHRNIANQFSESDDSATAVLEYAVQYLGVKHVAIVGHSVCGGCVAAHSAKPEDKTEIQSKKSLSRFLQPLIDLKQKLPADATVQDLIEANIRRGVNDISKSEIIQRQWAQAAEEGTQPVYIHGWFHHLSTGLIRDLGFSVGPEKRDDKV